MSDRQSSAATPRLDHLELREHLSTDSRPFAECSVCAVEADRDIDVVADTTRPDPSSRSERVCASRAPPLAPISSTGRAGFARTIISRTSSWRDPLSISAPPKPERVVNVRSCIAMPHHPSGPVRFSEHALTRHTPGRGVWGMSAVSTPQRAPRPGCAGRVARGSAGFEPLPTSDERRDRCSARSSN